MPNIDADEPWIGFNIVPPYVPGFGMEENGSTHPDEPGVGSPFFTALQDAARTTGSRANAFVNGGYSVLPGVYNTVRAVARGTGLLGSEEFRRFGQEADTVGAALGQVVHHPEPAGRAAREALAALADHPLLPYYTAGRLLMGGLTMLGPAATAGDALRAVEKGHNFIDGLLYPGIQGIAKPDVR